MKNTENLEPFLKDFAAYWTPFRKTVQAHSLNSPDSLAFRTAKECSWKRHLPQCNSTGTYTLNLHEWEKSRRGTLEGLLEKEQQLLWKIRELDRKYELNARPFFIMQNNTEILLGSKLIPVPQYDLFPSYIEFAVGEDEGKNILANVHEPEAIAFYFKSSPTLPRQPELKADGSGVQYAPDEHNAPRGEFYVKGKRVLKFKIKEEGGQYLLNSRIRFDWDYLGNGMLTSLLEMMEERKTTSIPVQVTPAPAAQTT